MLLLPSRLWKKCSRDCKRLKMNKEKRKLDGMESSKSKSDAHCMDDMRDAHNLGLSHDVVSRS